MTESSFLDQLKAASAARAAIRDWANGAELLAIMDAAHRSGLLHHLEEVRGLDDLATFTTLPPERI